RERIAGRDHGGARLTGSARQPEPSADAWRIRRRRDVQRVSVAGHGGAAQVRQRGRERREDRVHGCRDEVAAQLDVRDVGGRARRRADYDRTRVEAVEDRERAVPGDLIAPAGRAVGGAEDRSRRGIGRLHTPVERAAVVRLATAATVRVLADAESAAAVAAHRVAVVALLARIDAPVAAAEAAGAIEAAEGVTGERAAGIAERLAGGAPEVGAIAGLAGVAPAVPAGEASARVEREAARLAAQPAAVGTGRAAEVVAVAGFAGIAPSVAARGGCAHHAMSQIETAIRRAADRPASVLK